MSLSTAVDKYNASLAEQYDDQGVHWAEKYGVTLKIAQAACNYGGYIVTGTRHYCPIMNLQIDTIGHGKLREFAGGLDKVIQGFTDQYGRFYNREDAYVIAKNAGQIIKDFGDELYSESYI